MKRIKKISLYIEIFTGKELLYTNWSKNQREATEHRKRAHACIRTKYTRWQCMPAGVIDISKYAMADRSRRVLVRMTAALPTPPRTKAPTRQFYRTLHPSRICLGKFSENHVCEFPLVNGKSIFRYIVDDHEQLSRRISKFLSVQNSYVFISMLRLKFSSF